MKAQYHKVLVACMLVIEVNRGVRKRKPWEFPSRLGTYLISNLRMCCDCMFYDCDTIEAEHI